MKSVYPLTQHKALNKLLLTFARLLKAVEVMLYVLIESGGRLCCKHWIISGALFVLT
jgi:hypothetical protein